MGCRPLFRQHPASGILCVSDDVRHDHPGAYYLRGGRQDEFKALFAFIALWSVIVYYPMAHMVWGQGGFWRRSARLILPEEMWYISAPA